MARIERTVGRGRRLIASVTATAMRSPLAALKRGGLRPLSVTVLCSLFSLGLAMAWAVYALGAS